MTPNRVRAIALGLVLSLAAAREGSAQGPGEGFGPGAGPGVGMGRLIGPGGGVSYVMVLMAPAVQQELKLSDDQKTRLFDLARDAQQKGRAMMQQMFQAGGAGNPGMMLQLGGRLRQENEAATAKILKPEQRQRLDEIMLQIEDTLAVGRPEVAAKLNLTARQKQQVQATMTERMMAIRQIVVANGGFNGLGAAGIPRETMLQLRASTTRQLSKILDAKQKFNFNKLLGEPFDLAKIDPDLAAPARTAAANNADPDTRPATTRAEKARARRKAAATRAAGDASPDEGRPMP